MYGPKPIPQVLARPNLLLGGEREPVLLTGVLSLGIGLATSNIPGVVFAVGLWFGLIPLWKKMGKADPMMTRVYIRSLKYKAQYPARARPYRRDKRSWKDFWQDFWIAFDAWMRSARTRRAGA